MGTINRRGTPQRISKSVMQGQAPQKRGFFGKTLAAFAAIFLSNPPIQMYDGKYPLYDGKYPQKACACGCGRKSFSSTYFQLKCAVLHKRQSAVAA